MSGLPVNTFAQAKEYRKQYLANLALEAQNDAYNLMANQVYKQTGQPSRPPDTRTTTEKLADVEQMKVNVLNQLMNITDGQMASEAVANMTIDEIIFTSQMMQSIIADLKPKFARGIPSQALLSYIRALRQKELATNGVSFQAQEATAQAILNALQAGRVAGAPIPPFAPAPPAPPAGPPNAPAPPVEPVRLRPVISRQVPDTVPEMPAGRPINPFEQAILERTRQMGRSAEEVERRSQEELQREQEIFKRPEAAKKPPFNSVEEFMKVSWQKIRDWFDDASSKYPEVAGLVPVEYIVTRRGKDFGRLKFNPPGGIGDAKREMVDAVITFFELDMGRRAVAMADTASATAGLGMKPRALAPASRYPAGREILGYGLTKPSRVSVDMSRGIKNTAPTYVPFGKFIINPSKLSRGIFEVRTLNGGKMGKYPDKQLSHPLTKIMRRMIEDRMPDEYDFNEMDLEDQNFLFNLSKDAKINERLNVPTPKLSKEGEEQNRFEILKGQISSGNDNRELVKEFKQMLLRFSNDGRLKKNEAREILMDLTALGY